MRGSVKRLAVLLACAFAIGVGPVHADTIAYTYDALGRVLSVVHTNGITTTYTYDAAGNRATQATGFTKPLTKPVSITVNENSTNYAVPLNLFGAPATSVAVASPASNGSANASGLSITYTPRPYYVGPDVFWYTASGGGGVSDASPVYVTVNLIPPVAQAATQIVAKNSVNNEINTAITGGLPTGVQLASAPSHGAASGTANGLGLLYTPTTGFSGTDSLQYTASNSAGSSTAAVNITISTSVSIWGQFSWGAGTW